MSPLTIRTHDGATATTDALPTGVPGIAAHLDVSGTGWVLTHIRSGNGLGWFPPEVDPEALLACAAELAPLADWTASAHDLLASGAVQMALPIAERWGYVNRRMRPKVLDDLPAVSP